MKTIQTQLFNFDELSEDAQKEALNANRDFLADDPHWDTVYIWECEDMLKEKGYSEIDIRYSGFSSQGDGASATAVVDLEKWIAVDPENRSKFLPIADVDHVAKVVRASFPNYVHSNMIDGEVTLFGEDASNELQELACELEKAITVDIRALSDEIYKKLEDEYDFITSDECLTEYFIENERWFLENGTLHVD